MRYSLRGGLFENLVVMELFKVRLHRGREPGLYFVRDRKGNEIDVLVTQGRDLIPVEIKSAATFHSSMTSKLDLYRKWAGQRVLESHVVYGGDVSQPIGDHSLTEFRRAFEIATT